MVENRARIEQRLRRMFVRAVAGVDDRRREMPREKVRRAGRRMAHHDRVGPHRDQRVQRVDERFAFRHAGALRRDRDGIRAEAFGGDLEADARARRRFKEQVHHHASAQCIEALERFVFERLEKLGAVQDRFDLGPSKLLNAEKAGFGVHVVVEVGCFSDRKRSVQKNR